MAQLVEALRYKSEGRGFDSLWCHQNFLFTWSFRLHRGPGVDSSSDCATSRKVAGSIPCGVTGIFHWRDLSGCSAALGLTHPLTEMSIRNMSWGLRRPVRRADNLTAFICRLSWNLGASTSWNPQGLSRPVMVLLYLYLREVENFKLIKMFWC